ncbi:MAG TPA: acetyl-CoA carboxylase biotin carboxyl carrier protein [Terriglobales bacterium]|jgi:acetyl-CoA carboxylase biotin carboxyl carrier protein|nr:acetyl-CoA carboxylase biotin carboxyl carrier protein [Terriglobales bacterium]
MNYKELKELIEFLVEKDIAEFELERGDVKVRVKRGRETVIVAPETRVGPVPVASSSSVVMPTGITAVAPTQAGGKERAEESGLHIVKSPIVGTFYESPSPGSPPFVRPGDEVEAGGVLCIVEAMKLMNEIESDVAGEIVKQLVTNGQPVEYGQPLFAIRPK